MATCVGGCEDLKRTLPVDGGTVATPLAVGSVLFEVRLKSNVLFETERCIHSSRYLVVIHMYAPASNNEQTAN